GVDSPATSKRDQTRRAARWLESAGVEVAKKNNEPDADIEISPLFATSAQQLQTRKIPMQRIAAGEKTYLAG
ncbi:MAG TPA: hypothetical protein VL282_01785, partial [Tepidisphaeraceae bacterium]|nr:hypothetical protein [Tepidisphaeraceae bacterium]